MVMQQCFQIPNVFEHRINTQNYSIFVLHDIFWLEIGSDYNSITCDSINTEEKPIVFATNVLDQHAAFSFAASYQSENKKLAGI